MSLGRYHRGLRAFRRERRIRLRSQGLDLKAFMRLCLWAMQMLRKWRSEMHILRRIRKVANDTIGRTALRAIQEASRAHMEETARHKQADTFSREHTLKWAIRQFDAGANSHVLDCRLQKRANNFVCASALRAIKKEAK